MSDEAEYLDVQEPLPQQEPWLDAPQRFKVKRVGRRGGKSRAAWIASMIGHGPGWREGRPFHEAVGQGWDVAWLAPDYPQAEAIWLEEVKPRTEHLKGVRLNNSKMTLEVLGAGRLHVRSAESIKSLRGLGARLKGIVIDEGAHMDLESHWRSVVRPILMDNKGWAIFASTTNAGMDGNTTHRTPSYFNIICQEIANGTRSPEEWIEFYATAEDNPVIDPAEFRALVAEYPPESVQLAQEVYAKLLTAGAGLAFPEWRETHHVVKYEPPRDWRWFAGLDWGYSEPCAITFFATGPRDLLARSEIYVSKKTPYEVGYLTGQKAKAYPQLEYIAAGSDMWDVRDGGPTIAEEFQRGLTAATQPDPISLISVARGRGSREAGKLLIHEYLKYETLPDGTIPNWAGAKLRVHQDCKNLIRTLPARPIDPRNSEDALEGGDDHPYDSVRYGLMSRVPRTEEVDVHSVPEDRHPGWDLKKRQKKPRYLDALDETAALEAQFAEGRFMTGIRYSYGQAHPNEDDE